MLRNKILLMIKADFVVVGAGLTGSTIARILADHKQEVILIERKDHIAGNVFDYRHASGLMVHKYGPHYFRCGSEKIWKFLNRFSDFHNWSATLLSKINNEYYNWPVNQDYIDEITASKQHLYKKEPSNFEEACLAKIPQSLYERFIKGYTEKQWGVKATELDKELATRITINKHNINTLTPNHRWNALPMHGFTTMVNNMLNGIEVKLGVDFVQNKENIQANKLLIFTGPIDEYFNYKYGKLKYRGQQRVVEYLKDTDWYQPCVQVNYPDKNEQRIRTLEWKHLLPANEQHSIKGTVITHEIPFTPDTPNQYEYPFPDKKNKDLYAQYKLDADKVPDVLICGRLGEYKYYDMDQAIGRAMNLASGIMKKHHIALANDTD